MSLVREIKQFVSPGGTRIVRLYEKGSGRFFFDETYEDVEDLTHLGYGIERYWKPGFQSGIYDNVQVAERESFEPSHRGFGTQSRRTATATNHQAMPFA